jgi:uncharacterized membrane protein YbhN (UPF0104 family)
MVPITLSSVGVKKAASMTFFQIIGVSVESGLAIAIITRSFNLILSLLGGLAYLIEGLKQPVIKRP